MIALSYILSAVSFIFVYLTMEHIRRGIRTWRLMGKLAIAFAALAFLAAMIAGVDAWRS
jgi:hypothetical protein